DQYALAVSYCLLRGGRFPFEGNPAQMLQGHLLREPDLTMVPDLERPAVAKALAKKPDDRWPNCRAFVNALSVTASSRRIPIPPMPAPAVAPIATPPAPPARTSNAAGAVPTVP